MSLYEPILKTALLGTGKHLPAPEHGLADLYSRIVETQTDSEDGYLRYTAALIAFADAGRLPEVVGERLPACPEETGKALPPKGISALQESLDEADPRMLAMVWERALQMGYTAPPACVPALLDYALAWKRHRVGLVAFTGVVGKWLISLNPKWGSLSGAAPEPEDTWETGDLEARKAWLSKLRSEDPQSAIPKLEAVFAQEPAANRAIFVEALGTGLSLADEPFLQAQLLDKSKKVKDAAMSLLRRLAGSSVQRRYLAFVEKCLLVKEERYLLVSKRKVLELVPVAEPESEFFDTGIDRVSAEKGIPDHLHWLWQVVSILPPSEWLSSLGTDASSFLALLGGLTQGSHLISALERASLLHKDAEMALALLESTHEVDLELLTVLPQSKRKACEDALIGSRPDHFANYLIRLTEAELRPENAVLVLDHLAKNPHQIQRPEYRSLGLRLPPSMGRKIEAQCAQASAIDYQGQYLLKMWPEMARMIEFKEKLNF